MAMISASFFFIKIAEITHLKSLLTIDISDHAKKIQSVTALETFNK